MGSSRYKRYGPKSYSSAYGKGDFANKHKESEKERKARYKSETNEWAERKVNQALMVLGNDSNITSLSSLFSAKMNETITSVKLKALQTVINKKATSIYEQFKSSSSAFAKTDAHREMQRLWVVQRTLNKDWKTGGPDKHPSMYMSTQLSKYNKKPDKNQDLSVFKERRR